MTDTVATPTSVYLYFDETDVLIYVGVTSRGTRRQREHNSDKEWWPFVSRQEVRHFDSRPEALAEERALIVAHRPPFNTQHNPMHADTRVAYLNMREARQRQTTVEQRRDLRNSLRLNVMGSALSGDRFTLHSQPEDASVLNGELVENFDDIPVSTSTRARAGRVSSVRLGGGMLVIGIRGKFLPEEITHARAKLKIVSNRKPPAFFVARVLLNEMDHMRSALLGDGS